MGAKDFKEHPMQCIPHTHLAEKQRKRPTTSCRWFYRCGLQVVCCVHVLARASLRGKAPHACDHTRRSTSLGPGDERFWFAARRIALHVHSYLPTTGQAQLLCLLGTKTLSQLQRMGPGWILRLLEMVFLARLPCLCKNTGL
jgi:hypothetical protein